MNTASNFKKYKDRAAELLQDNERVQNLLNNASSKIKGIMNSNEQLRNFSNRIFLLMRMVKAQFTGDYTEVPWKTLTMIAGALLYFVTPIDLIPDFIPALGFTDDITIVYWVVRSIQEDIEKFEAWENTIEIS